MTEYERIKHLEAVMAATEGASPEVQVAAIAAIVPPADDLDDDLWPLLILGLLILLLATVCGVVYLVIDGKETLPVLSMFAALLTGFFGLFTPTPFGRRK
jgi:TctA family transporter